MNNQDRITRPPLGPSAQVHAAALAILLLALTGCGPGMIVPFMQTPEVKAEYKLANARLLVLINDDLGGRGSASVRTALQTQVAKELDEKKANQQVIPDKDVKEFIAREGFSRGMDEVRLAKAMNAKQILRIQLEPYSGALGGSDIVAEAQASCVVHVVDAETGDQKYPTESRGKKVIFKMSIADIHTTTPGPAMQEALGKGLGHMVARLFYTYRLTEMENLKQDAPSLEGF